MAGPKSDGDQRATPSPGVSRSVNADWNDIEAAAVQGCGDAEAVVHDTLLRQPLRIEYAIRTVDDLSGVLTFTRADIASAGERTEVTVFCRVGDFGDGEREQRIVREVTDRLRQLRGVDFAPSS